MDHMTCLCSCKNCFVARLSTATVKTVSMFQGKLFYMSDNYYSVCVKMFIEVADDMLDA